MIHVSSLREKRPSPSIAVTYGVPSSSTPPFTSKNRHAPLPAYGSTAGRPMTPGTGFAMPAFAPVFVHAVALPFGMLTP